MVGRAFQKYLHFSIWTDNEQYKMNNVYISSHMALSV